MKRSVSVAFSTLILCGLLLLITVGTIKAIDPSYTRTEWPVITEPNVDGQWTPDNEWTDTEATQIDGDLNVTFRSTWSQVVFVTTQFLIEIFNDNTNDTGDYWQICIDGNTNGGSAPQTDDFMIEVVGHTNLTVYQGTGTGWTPVTPDAGELFWANTISASPTSSTPHWIVEFTIWKGGGVILMGPQWGIRVAVYDESNSAAGVQAWPPPSDPDVPEGWGLNDYSTTPIPESLTFAVMVILLSVSVLIIPHYFRKWSRT